MGPEHPVLGPKGRKRLRHQTVSKDPVAPTTVSCLRCGEPTLTTHLLPHMSWLLLYSMIEIGISKAKQDKATMRMPATAAF
jgi:hypothetical protein